MSFADRLSSRLRKVDTPALLGIDPHLDLLPEEFAVAREPGAPRAERAAALERFGRELIDIAVGRVAAVKPQSAFFELFGADGVLAWERVVASAREAGLLVIGDVKRSDIASTAAAYASAFLSGVPGLERDSLCDAITLNPYLGSDTLEPFVDACRASDGGLFVLVRTSNPGSGIFQAEGTPPLCERVAQQVTRLGDGLLGVCGLSSIGAVVGATHPTELGRMRELMPRTPLLLPGYGAQGGSAADIVPALHSAAGEHGSALVNSSRGVAFAWRRPEHAQRHWKDAAARALDAMIADLRTVRALG